MQYQTMNYGYLHICHCISINIDLQNLVSITLRFQSNAGTFLIYKFISTDQDFTITSSATNFILQKTVSVSRTTMAVRSCLVFLVLYLVLATYTDAWFEDWTLADYVMLDEAWKKQELEELVGETKYKKGAWFCSTNGVCWDKLYLG